MTVNLTPHTEKLPVAIVGAGIIGLLTAWCLARGGRRSVVFDRQTVGGESSWAGAGILWPLDPETYPVAVLDLAAKSSDLYDKIAEVVGSYTDPELLVSGMTVQKGSRRQIFPSIRQIRNPRLLRGLRLALEDSGFCTLHERCEVTGFSVVDKQLVSITTSQGEMEIAECIVATGAWTGLLLKNTGLNLPIRPIRGQILLFRGRPSRNAMIQVADDAYLVPRSDGRVLVGSTTEDVGFDKSVTKEAFHFLYHSAVNLQPDLATCSVEAHWAGLRPGTPSGIPYIGRHPDIAGLYVCAGHHRCGFATAPASAQLVVDLLLGNRPSVNPDPYSLKRRPEYW